MGQASFYSEEELRGLGLKSFGKDVLISRKASIYAPENIEIGDHVRIDDFSVLAGGSGIKVGNYVHIACFCALYGSAGIVMEDFSGLSARVTLYTESDDYSGGSLTNPTVPAEYRPGVKRGKVVLRRHVIVGIGSTVLPGVELAEGAAVGAHSLVSKNCDSWSVYFGVPARRLKARKKNLLELEGQLLKDRQV